jgi:hypothetical protein
MTTTVSAPSPLMQLPAVMSIMSSYDMDTLRDIAEYGADSGCAHDHIYYTQTWDFFLKYEDDIEDYLFDMYGDDWLEVFARGTSSIREQVNLIVWSYINGIASDLVDGDN